MVEHLTSRGPAPVRPIDAPPSALTVTTAIRTALRRIQAGEPIGDLAHVLGSLYLHELVDDDQVNRLPFVTPLGLELLAAAPTVRLERPRLESRPIPDGVRRIGNHLYARGSGHGLPADASEALIAEAAAEGRALLELVDWLRWERAVRAQDGAS